MEHTISTNYHQHYQKGPENEKESSEFFLFLEAIERSFGWWYTRCTKKIINDNQRQMTMNRHPIQVQTHNRVEQSWFSLNRNRTETGQRDAIENRNGGNLVEKLGREMLAFRRCKMIKMIDLMSKLNRRTWKFFLLNTFGEWSTWEVVFERTEIGIS